MQHATFKIMTKTITIIDVSPRDGLQNEDVILKPNIRAELVKKLAAAGVPRIEIGSFVHPKVVPQMAGADQVAAELPLADSGRKYTALIPNMKGYELAAKAGLQHVRLVLAASEGLQQANFKRSVAESLADFKQIAQQAQADGIPFGVAIGASFGDPFDGEVPVENVLNIARELAYLGADEITLADTTGMAVPTQVENVCRQVIGLLSESWPDLEIGVHLHNTRNTGYANAFAAVQAGIRPFDSSLGGIGGCPFAPKAQGNIATEDLVHMLNGMRYETNIDLNALIEVSAWLSGEMSKTLPALIGKAGPVYERVRD